VIRLEEGTTVHIPMIADLLVDTWINGYREFMPTDILNELNVDSQILRHQKYFESGIKYVVALDSQEHLIGFGSFGANRMKLDRGVLELYTLYVGMDSQGKGVGKKLLSEIVNEISGSLIVSVFAKNPYKQFYTNNGFKYFNEETIEIMGHKLNCQLLILD